MAEFFDKYVFDKSSILGSGGYGSVFSGFYNERPVAVKMVERFKISSWVYDQTIGEYIPQEVAMMKRLRDVEGCIKIIDYHINPTACFIVMERPDPTQDLFEFVKAKGRLPEPLCRTVLKQIVQTTIECHEMGVFHNDLKEENILISPVTNKVKVIDFGTACYLHQGSYRYIQDTMSKKEWNFRHNKLQTKSGFQMPSIWSFIF
ncbi:serine/threonine-protein kinase pim-1-like [Amphiura filiformis]|uniref:serine/threonine-protein kinase pim-1-like n=1 Tax=Amphiura filiformis TaxID=82378 RepID=UPI003B21122B